MAQQCLYHRAALAVILAADHAEHAGQPERAHREVVVLREDLDEDRPLRRELVALRHRLHRLNKRLPSIRPVGEMVLYQLARAYEADGQQAKALEILDRLVREYPRSKVADEAIVAAINEVFDLRPKAIIESLQLLRPIYSKTAAYGHFGRELPEFTWEAIDRADALRAAVNA